MKTCAVRNSVPVIRVGVSIFLAVMFSHALPGRLAAQTRTNLAGSVTSESMTALWVARDRGLFKKHGLDMQFILMPRNPLAVAALLAGEIDAAIVGPGHVINAASSGADLIGIANLKQKLDYRLNARPEIKRQGRLARQAHRHQRSGLHVTSAGTVGSSGLQHRSEPGEDHLSDDSGNRNESALGA